MEPAIRNPLHVDPNDSLRSLVVRACRRRHLPHTWIIGERVGLASRNRANFAHSPDLDAVELARLLEVDVEVVTSRRHETLGNGRVNYWGLAVPTLLVELNQRRRFAPGAFGAGVPMPVHDTRWDMRLLPDHLADAGNAMRVLWPRTGLDGGERRRSVRQPDVRSEPIADTRAGSADRAAG